MPFVTRKTIVAGTVAVVAAAGVLGAFVWSGIYNVGADDAHTRPVHAVLQALRERSIAVRADDLQVPDLADPARIRQGAGNYDAMCVGCHLSPGLSESEMSKGLYPAPPDLTKTSVDAAEAFWVIKHGIKASGMPAWGKSMGDEYIWNMAAFLQQLPKLDAAKYRELVASSGGHSHGGGETMEHGHGDASGDHHEDAGDHPHPGADESAPHEHGAGVSADHHGEAAKPAAGETVHRHADGKEHVHAATDAAPKPATEPAPAPAKAAPETAPEAAKSAETNDTNDTSSEHDDHDHQH